MASEVVRPDPFQQARVEYDLLRSAVSRVIVGQDEVIQAVLAALLVQGHVLVEGAPGSGKTLLVRTLAEALDVTFRRVQFTPDLMPADILGTYVVMESHGQRKFEFQEGPLFAHLVLADEINRATPKTQAALLEALEEAAVTVANRTFELPEPFMLVATQGPPDAEGTFPLPETLLDRFLLKVEMQPPSEDQLEVILQRTTAAEPPAARPALTAQRLRELTACLAAITVPPEARRLACRLLLATRPDHSTAPESVRQYVRRGASPRGARAMVLAGKARALAAGRGEVRGEDLRALAVAALAHRLALSFEGHAAEIRPADLIRDVLESVTA